MTPFLDLFTYGVEVNWRLMWFPNSPTAHLKEVKVRTNSLRVPASELPQPGDALGPGTVRKRGFVLGQRGDDDPLGFPDHPVVAELDVGTGTSGFLEADIFLQVGSGAHSRTTLTIEPGAQIPFMLSCHADAQNPENPLAHTAAVVDGVFTGGSRPISYSLTMARRFLTR
jgi:hypothetical protein